MKKISHLILVAMLIGALESSETEGIFQYFLLFAKQLAFETNSFLKHEGKPLNRFNLKKTKFNAKFFAHIS